MSVMPDAELLDLFRMEAEAQSEVLSTALLALERDHTAADQLELCMRAAHSLKGAARIVGLEVGVHIAHVMEDCFVAAQQGRVTLQAVHIDRLLAGTDLLSRIAATPEDQLDRWVDGDGSEIQTCLAAISELVSGHVGSDAERPADAPAAPAAAALPATPAVPGVVPTAAAPPTYAETEKSHPVSTPAQVPPAPSADKNADRVLRVTAENLNRLLGLAGESLVESRWLKPFSESLLRVKRMQHECSRTLDTLREALPTHVLDERALAALADAQRAALECQRALSQRLVDLEMFDRRSMNLSHRLYDEALTVRMRPFGDAIQGYPRMVRDVAHALGKQVVLDVAGEATQVDRDILSKLDAPLGHLLRNAVDHGLESPEERVAAGKPAQGTIRLEARHSAGALQVMVTDDGRGIDIEKTREAVIARKLINREAAERLSEAELLEFLFLPGFTMKKTVTDISGRGVGLDAVQDMVKQVRGTVSISSQKGTGTRFTLHLPVTLSVVRALLAEIGGEPYAFPLTSILRTLKLSRVRIQTLEGRQHFDFDGRRIGLITAQQVLETEAAAAPTGDVPVIVLGDQAHAYGLVVDRFLGERELVVRPLDPQLGKIKDVSAGALMEDGSPVLIIDPDDLLRSLDRLASSGRPNQVRDGGTATEERRRKRVLVVDDSITVRELERKLLGNRGYEVEVAVDGMDGWNAVRAGHFDLVVTDIDMPRMDGIELVGLITKDPKLKAVPVMVVSYKDRDEDRRRGLEAGAAYYLTKGSFHDDTLLQAVVDLIGEAAA
jgi:two-component system, chemotaxis family, sensor histidine kinase and response regulator WspE